MVPKLPGNKITVTGLGNDRTPLVILFTVFPDVRGVALFSSQLFNRKSMDISSTTSRQYNSTGDAISAQLLSDELPLPLCLVGPHGSIYYINKAFTNLFGYQLHEIATVRQWLAKAYPDSEYRRQVLDTWRAHLDSMQGATSERLYLEITDHEGAKHPCTCQRIPLGDGSRMFLFNPAEKSTPDNPATPMTPDYRSIFQQMNSAFGYLQVVADDQDQLTDLILLEANQAFYQVTGLNEGFIGKRITELYSDCLLYTSPSPRD